MKQPDLFSNLPAIPARYPDGPGWTEPTTSKAAAVAIRPQISNQQKTIVEFLKRRGSFGATYNEIAEKTGIYSASVCGRMVELARLNLIKIAEFTRETPAGRQAKVYLAVDGK